MGRQMNEQRGRQKKKIYAAIINKGILENKIQPAEHIERTKK